MRVTCVFLPSVHALRYRRDSLDALMAYIGLNQIYLYETRMLVWLNIWHETCLLFIRQSPYIHPNAIMMDIRGMWRDWSGNMPWSWSMGRFPSYGVRTYLGPAVLNANGLPQLPRVIYKSLVDLWAPEKSGMRRIVSALTVHSREVHLCHWRHNLLQNFD
jgi:hypothetical protein